MLLFSYPQPLPYITVKKISKHRLFIEIIHVSLATILPWSYFQFPPSKKKFNFTMKMEFIIYVHITYILLTKVTKIWVNISVGIGSEKSFILESVI